MGLFCSLLKMKRAEGMKWAVGWRSKEKGERGFVVVLSYWTFSPRIGAMLLDGSAVRGRTAHA
jgi:hypothetical protein